MSSKYARAEGAPQQGGGWRHIDVRLNKDGTFEILESRFLNPLGPRMERSEDHPFDETVPRTGIATAAEAMKCAQHWDDWCQLQIDKPKRKETEIDVAKGEKAPSATVPVNFDLEPEKQVAAPPPAKPAAKATAKPKPAPKPVFAPDSSPLGLF